MDGWNSSIPIGEVLFYFQGRKCEFQTRCILGDSSCDQQHQQPLIKGHVNSPFQKDVFRIARDCQFLWKNHRNLWRFCFKNSPQVFVGRICVGKSDWSLHDTWTLCGMKLPSFPTKKFSQVLQKCIRDELYFTSHQGNVVLRWCELHVEKNTQEGAGITSTYQQRAIEI